jgi:prepilin-type processing-associated H-X9-DG protein/prepilin-type N-terminal cleavage/methylation domain-containing protein
MRQQHRKEAFTLIELLVVIAVIAVMAAVLFPVLTQARGRSRAISCVSNEKQLASGVLIYLQDYDEAFPLYYFYIHPDRSIVGPGDPPFSPDIAERTVGWNEAIYPYVKNVRIFRCPDTGTRAALHGTPFPNRDDVPTGAVTYAINARLVGDTGLLSDGRQGPSLTHGALEFVAVTFLITEGREYSCDGSASSDENEWGWEGRHVDRLYGDGWDHSNDPRKAFFSNGKPPLTRHNGGANYAFTDGHVKFLSGGAVGLMSDPAYPAAETQCEAAGIADNRGQHPTYCPNANCFYNVPPTP